MLLVLGKLCADEARDCYESSSYSAGGMFESAPDASDAKLSTGHERLEPISKSSGTSNNVLYTRTRIR